MLFPRGRIFQKIRHTAIEWIAYPDRNAEKIEVSHLSDPRSGSQCFQLNMAIMIFLTAFFRVQKPKFEKMLIGQKGGLPFEYHFWFVGIFSFRNDHISISTNKSVGGNKLIAQQELIVKIGFKFPEHIQWSIYQINQFIAPAIFPFRFQLEDDRVVA